MPQASHQNDPSSFDGHIDETSVPGFSGESFGQRPEDQDCLDPLEKFMDQVNRIPEAIAAVIEGEHVTYQELNRRANQLSHWLQRKGIGTETIVGVCLDRSISLVLTILGVIKAGGCLLPLEPSYPRNRLTYMVEDCQPIMVLTQERYFDLFQNSITRPIRINTIENNLTHESSQNPANLLRTGNLRVIFYTSGSTGQPKGVMEIYHKVIPTSDSDQMQDPDEAQLLKVASTDRMLVKCSMSFAPFLWELMSPLFAGGTAILAPPGGEQDFSYLIRLITNESVTVSHFVPSSLRVLLDQPDIQRCTSLTSVCCSGEILPDMLREHFFANLNADIFLTYAATEAPGATWVHLHRDNFQQPLKLNQQKTTKVYVLDSRGNLMPVQGQGELYVEASERIRGYLHQPALTAEKFVPDPFRSTPGTRLYRTGDLAKILSDGNFHVVGRKDQQVKIRGFRIELGEIEARLRQHPRVQDVAVLSLKDSQGDNRLIAYILHASDEPPEASLLRNYLLTQLPEYMLPALFMFLEVFPLTPNGKVDKGALPVPETADRTQWTIYVAPHNALEELLAKIWMDLLKVDQIGVHDNFFELGGHSLLATQVMARLRHILELAVPLRALFEHPTVAQLAKEIDNQLGNSFPDWPTN
jgi:amino acid adenylation domain-containing protein